MFEGSAGPAHIDRAIITPNQVSRPQVKFKPAEGIRRYPRQSVRHSCEPDRWLRIAAAVQENQEEHAESNIGLLQFRPDGPRVGCGYFPVWTLSEVP